VQAKKTRTHGCGFWLSFVIVGFTTDIDIFMAIGYRLDAPADREEEAALEGAAFAAGAEERELREEDLTAGAADLDLAGACFTVGAAER